MSATIGIDLGTTNTLVAILTDTGPIVLRDGSGSPMIPSAVAVDPGGRLLVGGAAEQRLRRDPSCGARWFKRDLSLGRTWTFGGRTWTAIELSAVVLGEARAWAEAHLGETVQDAVVTVPAYFQEPQRAATLAAADLAGLRVVRIVNEPTAAAIAYGAVDSERERCVAVVDLGGGTFDVTVLEIFDGVLEVVGTGGDGRLGGEDFTDALWMEACRWAGLPPPDASPGLVHALLRDSCEQARRALTELDFVALRLPDPAHDTWVDLRAERLTRARLRQVVQPLLDRVAGCIRDTLRAAGKAPADIDELVLAGGATRMVAVAETVAQVFGRPASEGPDPDLAVALGAALQGGLVTRHMAVAELVVTDVLAHSLGVEVSRDGERRTLSGYFMPILHRNTTLPARRVERVYTMHPQQRDVRLRVYAGEQRYTRDNRLLGEFTVRDLPPSEGDGRQGIDLSFAHDLNGLLEVEAEVVGQGRKSRLVIEEQAGRLTPEQRKDALAALAALKVLPRDLLPYRLLLEEALNRHARLPQWGRDLLDGPMFNFERALEGQEPAEIDEAARLLRMALQSPRLRVDEP